MLNFRNITGSCFFAAGLLGLASMVIGISPWWGLLPVVIWTVLTVIGSFHIRWGYHLNTKNCNRNTPHSWVSLTFDDGPNPQFTPKVLELLDRYGAKATFFCIGEHVAEHPGLAREIASKGHGLGNHTYTHDTRFGFFGTRRVVQELRAASACIESAIGRKPRLYRPAFGVTNPNIRAAVKQTGLQPIGWSIRSLDTTSRSSEAIFKRLESIQKGDVVLLHDTSAKTVAILERLLLFLQENQLRSVPVDQLLEIEAYA